MPETVNYTVDPTTQLSTNEVGFVQGGTGLADQESVDFLYSLAEALNSPDLVDENFVIEGHASAEGSSSANRVLSQKRANAIFDFLVQEGVDETRLLAVGHGEDMARYKATDPEHLRAEDRRVVILKLLK